MAVNLVCSECKSNVSTRAKKCKKCGYSFDRGRKYRVIVKSYDGKRTSRVLDNLNAAKTLEGKLKMQVIERNLFGIVHAPIIDDVWQKYLEWAKENKKSWKDDQDRWNLHVAQHISGQKMDQVSSYDIDSVIRKMALKKNYAPATIKHVIVLVRRVYNWATEMDLYSGDNPAKKIKLPKLNNEVTECLDKDQIKSLQKTLDEWRNQPAALLVKFGLFTGLRRGELFKLTWDCIDLENGWIRLKDTKGGKEAKLPISNEAATVLQKANTLLPHPDCSYVFPSRTGEVRVHLRGVTA